jgi:UDPglucose 6-dehydrogenase
MKIGIIGNGFVGRATALLKCDKVDIIIYDINPQLSHPINLNFNELYNCDLIFVCVPTPMEKNGKCHLDIITNVVKRLKELKSDLFIIVKSTVPPGTCKQLDVFFMPEFLRESNWEKDFKTQDWVVGLLHEEHTNRSFTHRNQELQFKMNQLISYTYKNGNTLSTTIHWVDTSTAEMIKYFKNSFLAVKVSFCNEIYDYCQKKNINYDTVKNIVTLDKRITSSHTQVPGPDGKKGYGGICFPKDIKALLYEFKENNIPSYILQASLDRNDTYDRKEKDWEKNVGRSII